MKNLFLLLLIGFSCPIFAQAQAQGWFEPSSVTRGGTAYTQKVSFYAFGGSKTASGGGGSAPASAPTLIEPANNSTNVANTLSYFDWSDVATATSYDILVDNDSSYSSPLIDALVEGASEYSYGGDPFACETAFYWKVRATNSYGSSAYSGSFKFMTASLTTPTLLTPSNGAIDVDLYANITFSWTPANAGNIINLQVAEDNAFSSIIHDETINGANTTFEISGGAFIPYTTYYWRVRHQSDACGDGAWSNTFNYTMAEF